MEKGKFKEKTNSTDAVSPKESRKTRRSAPSEIPLSDVQSSSACTRHHRRKTGPIRRALSTSSSQRRKRIPALTLADHDASQSTLEAHFVRPQTTPVSAYPPCAVSPNRERIRTRLFPLPPDEKENADAKILKHYTANASTSSSARKQPLRDHVAQNSSEYVIVGRSASGTAPTSSTTPFDSKPEERQLLKVCEMISESEQNHVVDKKQACFNAMLWWLEGNCRKKNRPPTWRVLLDVMKEAGFPDKAKELEENMILGVL